jgi:hypothetical protein
MSNQTSAFSDLRNVPNQSSSFPRRNGIQTVREIDGSPSISPVSILEVSNGTLTNPATGVARITTSAAGAIEIREVVLTFPDNVAIDTAISIQTGVYFGGGPAALDGDTDVTLPATGALFEGDGRIEIHLNGQLLNKGSGSGDDEVYWVSTTQVALRVKIKTGDELTVAAPYPTA